MEIYNLEYYKDTLQKPLDIKKLIFYKDNQTIISEYIQSADANTELKIKNKDLETEMQQQILDTFQKSLFIDLEKQTAMSEDILFTRLKTGSRVEVKNNFDIYTLQIDKDITYCTINGDREHAYYMKESFNDFGRVKGEIDPKFKSFKDILDTALTRVPTKLEKMQTQIDSSLETLLDKLDSKETNTMVNTYLKNMGMFHNYSFNNQMLLAIEAEKRGMNLEKVASFNTWRQLKDKNGKPALINKGEKGLPVITPVEYIKYEIDDNGEYILNNGKKVPIIDKDTGKPEKGLKFTGGFVFDISQLSNADSIREVLELKYRDKSKEIEDSVLENLIDNISKTYSVAIRFDTISSGAKAYYDLTKNEIVISDTITSNAQKISSLFHELGHKLMHGDMEYEDIHKNRGVIEGEAEAFSKVMSDLYGIENNSELYISTWGNTADELKSRLEKIATNAKKAIKTLGLDTMQNSISDIIKTQQTNQKESGVTKDRAPIEKIAELAKSKSANTADKNSIGYSDVAI